MIDKSKVKFVRFLNGDEVIAEVKMTAESLSIVNPVRLQLAPPQSPGGKPNLQFVDWLPFSATQNATVDRNHVLVVADVIPQLVDTYAQMFSPIALPTAAASPVRQSPGGLILP